MTTSSERTVVVTGGSVGIGAAITRAFYQAGDRVVVASRTDHGLAVSLGDRAKFVHCDVQQPADLHAACDAAIAWSGRLDVFINNAGLSGWRPVGSVDEAFWDLLIDTNLKGTFFGCQAAAARLAAGGCIINVSSLAGKRGSANNAVYCASKFGVDGVTQSLAKELGPRYIRVNAVCPVYVRTPGLLEALGDAVAPPGQTATDEYLAAFAASESALGRLPLAEEIAEVCVFLSSPGASAVTGQCVNVDCGVLPQ